jgi:excisionase family DNA binding protein
MEKQLSLGLESFSAGTLKNKASWKNHLSSKKQEKPKQPINELLPKKEKENNLKSVFLSKDKVQREQTSETSNLEVPPVELRSRKDLFFDNRINKLLSTKEASGLLGVSENALRILVCRKKVKAHKLGSRLKFKFSDLMDCLQQKEV